LSKDISDAGLSGITITKERENTIDFSHSYFQSGLSVLLRNDEKQTFWSEILFLGTIIKGILPYAIIFVGLMFIVGILIVLMERKTNPQFKHIIWDGMYWANVILATVGLGDKCPTTKGGKALTMILMSVGIFFITPVIISKISSEMTVHKMTESITCKEDLKKRLVGVVKSTTSETAMKKLGAKHVAYENIDKAVQELKQGRVDAVVFDLPAIKYEDNLNDDLKAVNFTFDRQDYGIALSKKSPYRKMINLALLSIKEDGTYEKIYSKYFGGIEE
jgi:ABC-type amino acid transport substrate-binding protein